MNPISTEAVVRCEWCDGCGVISYNPNLNPNEFFGHAVVKCVRCNGTGTDKKPMSLTPKPIKAEMIAMNSVE